MSEVDVLREYGNFKAARVLTSVVSSATNVFPMDVTHVAGEAATNIFATWQAIERQRHLFLTTPRTAWDVSSTGSPNLVIILHSAREELFGSTGNFSALDELRTPEGRIRQEIRSLRGNPDLIYREQLAVRLEALLDAMKEEGESWNEDSPESLRMMLLFLQAAPDFRCPTVTVTPSATFRAQWTVEPNKHFAADFLADGQARFVVFCPDPRRSDRTQRISGITSRENLLDVVKLYGVHHWAVDART